MRLKIAFLLMALFVSGCASTYKQSELKPAELKLDRNLGVLISTPPDGSYESKQYQDSGIMTANAIKEAFSQHASNVELTTDCNGSDCFRSIDIEKYGYFVKPSILHWEDRNTEWSGKSDRIEIQIVVYDAVTQKELANSTYTGKSKWATLGGDHPQDLLPDPTNQYVNTLYGN